MRKAIIFLAFSIGMWIGVNLAISLGVKAQTEDLTLFTSEEGHLVTWENYPSQGLREFPVENRPLTEGSTHVKVKFTALQGKPFDIGFAGAWPEYPTEWHTITPAGTEPETVLLPIGDLETIWIFYIGAVGHDHIGGNPAFKIILESAVLVNIPVKPPFEYEPSQTLGASQETMDAWRDAMWMCCGIWIECGDITIIEADHHLLREGPPAEGEGVRIRAKFGECD